ncbi:MAG: hypothetical protein QNK37_35820 [Acidobacteriota bacterium]|nr:hypothetical protein [Acidobacteriota bacterium]
MTLEKPDQENPLESSETSTEPAPVSTEVLPQKVLPDHLSGTSFDTSEKELIISVATVFSLLQVMQPLADQLRMLQVQFPDTLVLYMIVIYSNVAVACLICAFFVHLAARGFWIGLLGLNSVFPGDVDLDKQPMGPLSKAFLKKRMPSIERLIGSVDRFGSLIFAVGSSIAIMNLFFCVLIGLVGLAALALTWWLPLEQAFFLLLGIMLGLFYVLVAVDQFFRKYPQKLKEGGLIARWWPRCYKVAFYFFGSPLYGTIFSKFTSHIPVKKFWGIIAVFLFASILILYYPLGIFSRGSVEHRYFSMEGVAAVNADRYANLRPKDTRRFFKEPFIDTDVVRDPYLKLFLPMNAKRLDTWEANCEDLPTLEDVENEARREAAGGIIDCARRYYRVSLNGDEIQPDLLFHQDPQTRVLGFLAYIPVRDLENGKHVLRVARGFGDDPRLFDIPFWK